MTKRTIIATLVLLFSSLGNATIDTVKASLNGCAQDADTSTRTGTDDAVAIQAMLNTAHTTDTLCVLMDGSKPSLISTTLAISSRTFFDCSHAGSGLFLKDASNCPMMWNAHKSSTATKADSIIRIIGNYPSGTGGLFDGNGTHQNGGVAQGVMADGTFIYGLLFSGVAKLDILNIHVRDSNVWGISICNSALVNVDHYFYNYRDVNRISQDGIDLRGPDSCFTIKHSLFSTVDDAIALNARDFGRSGGLGGPWAGTGGAIKNVTIDHDTLKNALFGIDIISDTEFIDNISITNITGTVQNYWLAIGCYPYYPYTSTIGGGHYGTFLIDTISTTFVGSPFFSGGGTYSFFEWTRLQANIPSITFSNITGGVDSYKRPKFHVWPNYTVNNLTIGYKDSLTNTSLQPTMRIEGYTPSLSVNGTTWTRTADLNSRWWLAGGASQWKTIAAYQSRGAVSIARSYINVANPGIYNAGVGVAPTWDSVNGWISTGTAYLTTTITPPANQTWSAICRFSGCTTVGYNALFGFAIVNTGFQIQPNRASNQAVYVNGGYDIETPVLTSGIMGISGNKGYRNGSPESGIIATGSFTPGAVYILGVNGNGTPVGLIPGDIQALAVYDTVLTASQMSSLTTAMNGIGRLPLASISNSAVTCSTYTVFSVLSYLDSAIMILCDSSLGSTWKREDSTAEMKNGSLVTFTEKGKSSCCTYYVKIISNATGYTDTSAITTISYDPMNAALLSAVDTVKIDTAIFCSGYTFTKPVVCKYAHVTTTSAMTINKGIVVRDSLVYDAGCAITALAGSAIYSTPGYTLVVKLNGKTGTPAIHNRSRIRWL